jgi:hypothetical protein
MAMKTVIGIVENADQAKQAVEELLKSGFHRREIGVISSDVMREAAAALSGGSTGAAIGGLAGMLLAASAMVIPGIGPVLAAGPALTLVGGTTLGALAGGIVGSLKAKGIPEDQANFYAEGMRRGGTLITVLARNDDLAARAVDIIKRHGALDVEERVAQWRGLGWSGRFGSKEGAEKASMQEQKPPAGVSPIAAVEVYSVVIETPDERRVQTGEYGGPERRKAA